MSENSLHDVCRRLSRDYDARHDGRQLKARHVRWPHLRRYREPNCAWLEGASIANRSRVASVTSPGRKIITQALEPLRFGRLIWPASVTGIVIRASDESIVESIFSIFPSDRGLGRNASTCL
jgi:hypothetical protein